MDHEASGWFFDAVDDLEASAGVGGFGCGELFAESCDGAAAVGCAGRVEAHVQFVAGDVDVAERVNEPSPVSCRLVVGGTGCLGVMVVVSWCGCQVLSRSSSTVIGVARSGQ